MTEVDRILAHYERAMNGSAWHGDPVWQILDDISADEASKRGIPQAHTIWELVSHMTFGENVAAQRLAGASVETPDALNFPAMPAPTEEHWQAALTAFRESNARFREAVCQLPATQLDELTARRKRTFYQEAHGLITHNVYHAAQIALMKRRLR